MLVKDARWKESADIVVVGYGGAGAVAAITAHDLGAEVLVVEKQPRDSHYTNTQMSGGVFLYPNDKENGLRHLEAIYRVDEDRAWTDRETLRAFTEFAYENRAWVEALGAKGRLFSTGAEHRVMPGWEAFDLWRFYGSGLGMHRFLTSSVAQRSVRVLFDAPALKLLTDLSGSVVGVRVAVGEGRQTMDIKAHRAVIMANGGFEFDEPMKLNYLRVYPTHFYGTPANTGDGQRMVMELGADLWHMNCCSARLVAKFPDFPIAFSLDFVGKDRLTADSSGQTMAGGQRPGGYVVVDRDGKRFTSENFKDHTLYYELAVYDSHRLLYPRVPSFWIFDQKRMSDGPLCMRQSGPAGPVQLYHWSLDNREELERGWILQGDSVGDLAEKLGLPVANLEETVRRYNSYCRDGHDPEFNRRPSNLVALEGPPFYGVRLYPGGPNTQGGPRRDHRARVLNVDGEPIPRLYAAGELGSVYGMLYPGRGGNLSELLAFGRIAAENAARQEAR
ncbi:MAG: FAD-binding protein [Chloroflexi bacterium]|nr:FAD-binding protein [Chloroflexota bacterium]